VPRQLLALATAAANQKQTVEMFHVELAGISGISKPHTLAKAFSEIEAIGLFAIDRGGKGSQGRHITDKVCGSQRSGEHTHYA
jgi:hypothetical protein